MGDGHCLAAGGGIGSHGECESDASFPHQAGDLPPVPVELRRTQVGM